MTRNVKVFLSLFLVFAMLSVLATAVVAEPTGETVPVTVNGNNMDGFYAYFNGANAPALQFDAPVGAALNIRIEPAEGYQVDVVKVFESTSFALTELTPDENLVYTIENIVSGGNYSIQVTTTYVGVPDEPSDTPSDDSSDTPSDTPSEDPSEDPSDAPSEDPSDAPSEDTSDTPSDTPSEDPSDTPSDVPSDDPSGDTSSDVPVNTAELKVTIKGAGSVTVGSEVITSEGGELVHSMQLEVDVTTAIIFAPAYGYRMVSLKLDGNNRSLSDTMNLTINEYTTLEVEFAPESATPETYQVEISCGTAGGFVTAGGYNITDSMTLTVAAGESLTIVVTPKEGYQVESFKVGNAVQNLTGGTFVLENIASNTTVSVSFKAVVTQINPMEAADIDWTPQNGQIVIDLTGNPYVGKSVFDKINTLTSADAQTVVFKTDSVQWFIPCGGVISGVDNDYVKMYVAIGPNGAYYETLKIYLLNYYPNAVFQYYELAESITMPAGTMVSFNLSGYASTTGGDKITLWAKVKEDGKDRLKVIGEPGVTRNDGWTNPMTYENSTNLFAIVEKAVTYKVDVMVTIGGTVDPSGNFQMGAGESKDFKVQANKGYVISALYVGGVLQTGAEGKETFTYTLFEISADCSIRAEFMPVSDYEELHGASDSEASDDGSAGGSSTGLIVAIVIIVVAIAGAAALFIVKWRQEKF